MVRAVTRHLGDAITYIELKTLSCVCSRVGKYDTEKRIVEVRFVIRMRLITRACFGIRVRVNGYMCKRQWDRNDEKRRNWQEARNFLPVPWEGRREVCACF